MENPNTEILKKCSIESINGVDYYIYKPSDDIISFELLEDLKNIFDLETQTDEYKIITKLKGLDTEILIEAFRYSMSRKDLKDPLMILNIINLIKIFNTLDDSFFENEDVYIDSIEAMVDIRLELQDEIEDFIKELSVYYLSLFKSYNKLSYTPTDVHHKLPTVYKIIFLSTDLLTLSGIFSVSKPFNTDECVFLDDGIDCLFKLQEKSTLGLNLFTDFLKDKGDGE